MPSMTDEMIKEIDSTTMTRISKHTLLLPTGRDPLNQDLFGKTIQVDRIDDYLSLRHEFRGRATVEYVPVAIQGTINDVMNPLRQVSSQIEIAMALCCERIPNQAVQVHPPRSATTKRIAFPTPTNTNDPVTDASASSHGATNLGVLREGKEGYFLKLLSMYCPRHAVGNRALVVAILQRTVEWEKTSILGNSPSETISSTGLPDTKDEQHSQNTDVSLGIGQKDISCMMPSTRTKSFLAAGGMKLLSRWLVDSYSVVSNSSSDHKKLHVASPTGCLLLPLLGLLEAIPFDKKLIVASNINKSIKRLKKALNIVAEGLDPTSLEEATHPIAGGLSVGKVIAATDAVMASWTTASTVCSKIDIPFQFNAFDQLRKKIRSRYDTLVAFRQEQGSLPIRSFSEYLKIMPDLTNNSSTESSIAFLSRSFPTSQLLRSSSSDKQWSFRELQANMEINESDNQWLSRKRKGDDDLRNGTLEEVSWNDPSRMNSLSSGPSKAEAPSGDTDCAQEYSSARVKREEDSF